MDILDIQDTLSTFRIVVDTREQPTPRARMRLDSMGVPYERHAISYGDYAYNITLPDGSDLLSGDAAYKPVCVVERKMDLDELAACMGRGRKRFTAEFERATGEGCRVWLLVEGATFKKLFIGDYRSQMASNALTASLFAFSARYGISPIFCSASESGRIIKEILYRDCKHRLERGDFG